MTEKDVKEEIELSSLLNKTRAVRRRRVGNRDEVRYPMMCRRRGKISKGRGIDRLPCLEIR